MKLSVAPVEMTYRFATWSRWRVVLLCLRNQERCANDAGAATGRRSLHWRRCCGCSTCAGGFLLRGSWIVFTAAYLLKRGYCCNSNCRHCPYR